MSSHPKLVTFLQNLLEATKLGKVQWEETPEEDSFRVFLDRAIVRVSRGYDICYERTHWAVSLEDNLGKVLDELSSERTDDARELSLLGELFEHARRQALNVDGLLDGLIQTLGNKR